MALISSSVIIVIFSFELRIPSIAAVSRVEIGDGAHDEKLFPLAFLATPFCGNAKKVF